jgi:hypothetical protein
MTRGRNTLPGLTQSERRKVYVMRQDDRRKAKAKKRAPDIDYLLSGTISPEGPPTPEDIAIAKDNWREVGQHLLQLDARTHGILTLHFGLDGKEPLTCKEISGLYGICGARAAQIVEQGLRKLAHRLRHHWPDKHAAWLKLEKARKAEKDRRDAEADRLWRERYRETQRLEELARIELARRAQYEKERAEIRQEFMLEYRAQQEARAHRLRETDEAERKRQQAERNWRAHQHRKQRRGYWMFDALGRPTLVVTP